MEPALRELFMAPHLSGGRPFCRRLYFDELLGRAVEKAAKEEKRRVRAAEDFTSLLRATKAIGVDTTWDEASVLIASDRDYQAVRPESQGCPPRSRCAPSTRAGPSFQVGKRWKVYEWRVLRVPLPAVLQAHVALL